MKIVVGRLLGVLLLLTGSTFVVAAFGGLGDIGIQSLPQQWIIGVAGLLGGRILLVRTLPSRATVAAVPIGLDARIEEIANVPLQTIDQ